MFFGGWLYPLALSSGVTAGEVAFNENELDCAARNKDVAEAKSAPARRNFKAFWAGISSLHFNSSGKTDKTKRYSAAWGNHSNHEGEVLLLTAVIPRPTDSSWISILDSLL
jgi:hypothetical protein